MKIAVIHSIFPPYTRGGAEQVVFATASAFAEAGHDVFVITCAPFEGGKNFAGRWETMGRIRVFRFTPFNLFTIFNIGKYPALLRVFWHIIDMFNPHTYLVVKKILAREKPDLIITRNLKGLGYTIPAAIRHSSLVTRNSKWFHGLHDLGALHPRGFMEWGKEDAIGKPMLLVRLYRAVCRILFGSPDVVVAPSQFVLDEYERAGFFQKAKTVVIGNPVIHNAPSSSLSLRAEGQPSLSLREGDQPIPPLKVRGDGGVMPRFLYIGQLEPYKGLRVLLSAWKEFSANYPKAILEIIGKGSMEDEVQRVARSLQGVVYRGLIPHSELPTILYGARATIVPSLAYETFGMSAAESIAYGVPVVASRIGALLEVVSDNENGILVLPGDVSALKQAMERIMKESFPVTSTSFLSAAQYREALEKLLTM